MEVTKWLKPSISVSRIGDSASVQAATRVNAEQASKMSMCRPTRRPFRGRLTRLGEMSEEHAQPLHRGSGGRMYTRKARATREREQSRQMNRSAEDGAWWSPHYGDEGAWVPLRRTKVCAGDTVGKSVSDSGRPGIVRRQGMAGIVRHSQTKGRATGNAKPSLKPANGRCGYKRKRNSGRCGARSRIGARYS